MRRRTEKVGKLKVVKTIVARMSEDGSVTTFAGAGIQGEAEAELVMPEVVDENLDHREDKGENLLESKRGTDRKAKRRKPQ